MSSSERRSLTRRTLALLVVLGMALPAIVSSNRVALRVDGARTTFSTYAETVGDVLANRGVELAAGDQVVPPPRTPIEDGTRIRILRTIEVGLVIDDQPERRVRGTFGSVAGVLSAVGITDTRRIEVTPRLHDPVEAGDVVRVRTPQQVTVRVDGQTLVRDTLLTDLRLLLHELDIEVRDGDLVAPELDTPISGGLELVVQRVDTEELVEEVVLPFEREERTTDALYEGQSRVVQQGAEGLRRDTYALTLTDGVETDRTLVGEEVVREPVTHIVERGTRKRPVADPDNPDIWYKLAWCESRHDWDYNGSSGFDGGLQFHPDTWRAWRYAGYPDYAYQATPEQQIAVGQRLQSVRGWYPWPSCARKLGLIP